MAQMRLSGLAILAMVVFSAYAAHAQFQPLCSTVESFLRPCQPSILDSAITLDLDSECCSSLQGLELATGLIHSPQICQCEKSLLNSISLATGVFIHCMINPPSICN
ncbi:hypothetical protein AMTR_s00174p00054500 [Amborella trichopoda]|uniref:Bifunctional inhibitor/plant lipid transfer protein/seed storage helical domain-containing protein n=1 Tax=Amborella trichopoda TaxID=13333 RepID=U5CX14_AMBTC|nr:hypothetical protein AMTR_s00174p00054500 [Amborella trichopoda]